MCLCLCLWMPVDAETKARSRAAVHLDGVIAVQTLRVVEGSHPELHTTVEAQTWREEVLHAATERVHGAGHPVIELLAGVQVRDARRQRPAPHARAHVGDGLGATDRDVRATADLEMHESVAARWIDALCRLLLREIE